MRIYIDTSVIGGCCDEEFAEWSLRLMQEFRDGVKIAVISDITLQELEIAPEIVRLQLKDLLPAKREYVILDDEALQLAQAYLQGRCCMKSFDAVKTMRDIRTHLSKRYQRDARRQIDDLKRIREKYTIQPSPPIVKKSKVAEDEAKYGDTDS